jgi:hypothetical protein
MGNQKHVRAPSTFPRTSICGIVLDSCTATLNCSRLERSQCAVQLVTDDPNGSTRVMFVARTVAGVEYILDFRFVASPFRTLLDVVKPSPI